MKKIYHSELPIIDFTLPSDLHKEVESAIKSIKLEEIETDEQFRSKLNKLKSTFVQKPIEFGEPKILNHKEEEREYPATYSNPAGWRGNVFVITVQVPFEGSPKLFKYRPNGYHFGSSNLLDIFQPEANTLSIELDFPQFPEKQRVIDELSTKMELTYQFIRMNNSFISNYNNDFIQSLEVDLKSHKEKLLLLYK